MDILCGNKNILIFMFKLQGADLVLTIQDGFPSDWAAGKVAASPAKKPHLSNEVLVARGKPSSP